MERWWIVSQGEEREKRDTFKQMCVYRGFSDCFISGH